MSKAKRKVPIRPRDHGVTTPAYLYDLETMAMTTPAYLYGLETMAMTERENKRNCESLRE